MLFKIATMNITSDPASERQIEPGFRVILHLDLDAYFASVEQRDHPEWRGKPVIVGAPPTQRGVVATASYEARKFGIHSAMASVTAGRLCPEGIFVTPRIDAYRLESKAIMAIMAAVGTPMEQVSIDEAYLDLSSLCQGEDADTSLKLALPIARQLKDRILFERKLSSTVGIGANKLLSKLASDLQKPDGLTLITEREKVARLREFSVRKLFGVGEVTEQLLNRVGIRTVGDLQDYPNDLRPLVGSSATRLKNFAMGMDDRPLEFDTEAKSISVEETFLQDTADQKILLDCLWSQAAEIEAQLLAAKKEAYTVQIKVRYSDFTTPTRQITSAEPVNDAKDLYAAAYLLLQRHQLLGRPIRLLGLGVGNLRELGARQLMLL